MSMDIDELIKRLSDIQSRITGGNRDYQGILRNGGMKMQIVIDKDKEIRKLKEMLGNLTDEKDLQSVRFAINLIEGMDGTPIPKGHGRLIDADALKRIGRYAHTNIDIENAPTIIEADKE